MQKQRGSDCCNQRNKTRRVPERPIGNTLEEHRHGWQDILVTDFEHPYMDKYWVPGTTIGYEHTFINAIADFLMGLQTGEGVRPNFRDALETQRVCDAVLKSAETGQWETIPRA